MSKPFRIFKKKWNYDRMMNWLMPIDHIGANCGELAISYLGLVSNEVCIKDSYDNLMRGNYGRLTSEISNFINENNMRYNVNFDNSHNLNACDFLLNNSTLAEIIGKNRETMVLLHSHKQNIGHYVVLAVVDDERIIKNENKNHIYLLDTSFGNYYSGLELINYLKDNNFYTEKDGVNINFLEILEDDSMGSFKSTINSNSNNSNNNMNNILSQLKSVSLASSPNTSIYNTLRSLKTNRKKYSASKKKNKIAGKKKLTIRYNTLKNLRRNRRKQFISKKRKKNVGKKNIY